jgi:hypothetical protein
VAFVQKYANGAPNNANNTTMSTVKNAPNHALNAHKNVADTPHKSMELKHK